MKNKILVIISICLFLFSTPIFAFEVQSEIGLRDGYTSYTINDSSDSWQSLLEFPMDYSVLKLNYKKEFNNTKIKSLSLSYLTNLDDPGDPFIDSDWLSTEGKGEPDIYAETESEIDMSEIDIKLVLSKDLTVDNKDSFLGTGLGYKFSNHGYKVVGPGYQEDYVNDVKHTFGDGIELIDYDLDIKAPYLLLHSNSDFLEANFKYYPYVQIEDLDHHILRNKYSEGKADGNGFEINLKFNKKLKENLFFNVGLIYETIEAEGEQKQWFTDKPDTYNVDYKFDYHHKTFQTGITYLF